MKRVTLALLIILLFAVSANAQYQFDEEFNDSSVNTTTWSLYNGNRFQNNELQYYLPQNVTESSGYLDITADYVTSPVGGQNYTGGYAQTKTFNFLYGTVEIRALMPGGTGIGAAFWLLGADCQATSGEPSDLCNWPYPGSDEIDMTEVLHSDPTHVNQEIHTMSGGTPENIGCKPAVTDVSQNWHTYTLIWKPGSLTWQIDGTTTCTQTQFVPSTPMYLTINDVVGGDAVEVVDNSTFPQSMLVDYVHITTASTPIYQVTPSADANGSISPSSPVAVNPGNTATFTVTPNPGYYPTVGGTCGGTLSGNTYTTQPVTAACAITAGFTQAQSVPTNVTATPGNSQATVSFTPAASPNGNPITGYIATSTPGGITASGTGSPITVSGLTNGTTYTFTVAATSASGTGSPSAPSNAVTPGTIPGVPTNVSATAGDGLATVNFKVPSNGGNPIKFFTVTSSPGNFQVTGAGSPITVSGLTDGDTYTFTVTATNQIGTSAPSAPSNPVTPSTVSGSAPGAPTNATATAGNAQATVSFAPPASNGGSAITGYTVKSSPGGVIAGGPGSPITVTGLTNGTAYTFTVTAANAIGTGPSSAPSNQVTPSTVTQTSSWTYIQTIAGANSVSMTNSSGDLLVVELGYTGTFKSFSDSRNTYAQIGPERVDNTGHKSRVYYARNIGGGANRIAATVTGGTVYNVYASEYSGVSTVDSYSVTAANNNSSGSFTSGAIATTGANELLWGFCWSSNDNVPVDPSGWTLRSNFDGNLVSDRNSANPGNFSFSGTIPGKENDIAWIVAFK